MIGELKFADRMRGSRGRKEKGVCEGRSGDWSLLLTLGKLERKVQGGDERRIGEFDLLQWRGLSVIWAFGCAWRGLGSGVEEVVF